MSRDDRFFAEKKLKRERQLPGPGDYENRKPGRHVHGVKFYYRPGAAPNFNEKNPLNFVKPITVNVYFKGENPAPN